MTHFWISAPIFLGPVLAIWGWIKYDSWRQARKDKPGPAPELVGESADRDFEAAGIV